MIKPNDFEELMALLSYFSDEFREWGPPLLSHSGPCTPEAGCDAACMEAGLVYAHNRKVRELRKLYYMLLEQDD